MIRVYLTGLKSLEGTRREQQRKTAELLVEQVCGCRLQHEENGKPVIENGFVSISHSGDLVALAVSERPLGVDLEELRPRPFGFWQRIFGESVGYPDWCTREAYVKLLGTGFTEHPRTVQVPESMWVYTKTVGDYQLAICAEEEAEVCVYREGKEDVWETALLHR